MTNEKKLEIAIKALRDILMFYTPPVRTDESQSTLAAKALSKLGEGGDENT